MLDFYWAGRGDIDLLVQLRKTFLKEVSSGAGSFEAEQETRRYFESALEKDECCCLVVKNGTRVVGTGIVFFYRSVPSLENPKGTNAYITSMYVDPAYRRRGIATQILARLCRKARENGCKCVTLHPSEPGKRLYQSYGFQAVNDLMRMEL